jgi:hypothetical protein
VGLAIDHFVSDRAKAVVAGAYLNRSVYLVS